MANPQVSVGVLNLLQASIVWPDFPNLNVTPSFLGDDGIVLSLQGEASVFHRALTARVPAPQPYLAAEITINLLKTQSLGNAYKAQMELLALIGDCTVRPDSKVMAPFDLVNCSIQSTDPLSFAGKTPNWVIKVGGTYQINSSLWDQAV